MLASDDEEYKQSSESVDDDVTDSANHSEGDARRASDEDGGSNSEVVGGVDESNNIGNNNIVRVGDVTNIDGQRDVGIIFNGPNIDRSINVGPSDNPNDVVVDDGAVNNHANNHDDKHEANQRADSTDVTSKRRGVCLEDFLLVKRLFVLE